MRTMATKRKTQHSNNTSSSHHNGRAKITKQIALGAAGVAVTAGVVAAGAALMNRRTRTKKGKMVTQGKKMLEEQVPEMYQMYQRPTAHQVSGGSKTRSKRKNSTRSQTGGRSAR
jgi:hypothetical protein